MGRVKAEDNREIDLMFIHSELDDLGLDPYEFRIYSRLVRRAGKSGVAHESVANMAAGCRMSERKARQALRALEAQGLVARAERKGETTVYTLTHQRHWKRRPEAASPAPHAAPTPAPDAAPPRHDMPPTPAPHAAKGNPMKVIPLKEETPLTPQRGEERAPAIPYSEFLRLWNEHRGPLPGVTTINERRRRAIRQLVKEHGLQEALGLFRDATREVAADEFYVARQYGVDTLLRGKVLARAEKFRSHRGMSSGDRKLAATALQVARAIGGNSD